MHREAMDVLLPTTLALLLWLLHVRELSSSALPKHEPSSTVASPRAKSQSPVLRHDGEIRCYCNDVSCVRTGYMCKSAMGRCFSRRTYSEGQRSRSIHGCVDFLPPVDRSDCEGEGDVIKTQNGPTDEWPILVCCKDDMCNYIDNLDINIYVNTISNGSFLKGHKGNQRNNDYTRDHRTRHRLVEESPSQSEVWFKAAVIAVPIAGGFILILLVLLAVRMLRSDSRRHHRLMQMRKHRSLTKAQLYVADHFSDKHDRNAHYNPLGNSKNVYRDVNIRIDCDGTVFEKQANTKALSGSCSSILIWGNSSISDKATVV